MHAVTHPSQQWSWGGHVQRKIEDAMRGGDASWTDRTEEFIAASVFSGTRQLPAMVAYQAEASLILFA